jgi:hypothetical protein
MRLAGEGVDERKPDGSGWPVDDIGGPVRGSLEVRLEVLSFERAAFVGMRVAELGQVVQEELPESLDDLVPFRGQFA